MSWTKRSRADAGVSGLTGGTIYVADAPALVVDTYSAVATVSCVVETLNAIVALKGITGSMAQQAASASLLTGQTVTSQAFGSNNAAGNSIIVAITCAPNGFGPCHMLVTDSQGNTYTEIMNVLLGGGLQQLGIFLASGIHAGANTVTVTATGGGGGFSNAWAAPAISVLEYPGAASLDVDSLATSATGGSLSNSLTTTGSGETLLNIVGIGPFCSPTSPTLSGPTGGIPPGWLVVYEYGGSPAVGSYVDRSKFLFLGQGGQHSFNLQIRQRGTASYTLVSSPSDPDSAPADYSPTLFQPIFLFDQNASGYTLVFSGVLQDFTNRWVGIGGLRYIDCTAVTFEQIFDTIYCDGTDQFVNEDTGTIFTALFNKYETGCPISLGTVQAGVTIPLFDPQKGQKLSGIFQQLALTSGFIWGVNPQLLQVYFAAPTATPAPFNLESSEALWDTISQKIDGADFRNRQGIKGSDQAFPQSGEWFAGSGQQTITLLRPVKQLVSAYITLGTPNFATGTFSGQPSPGDTITIGPQDIPFGVGNYLIDQVIVQDGFVQQVTTPGLASTTPTFSHVTGGTSTGTVAIFTCRGPYGVGAGVQATNTYTFVSAIDNTQYGQVLIGATLAATVQNLVDAINSTAPYGGPPATAGRGVTFSLPTWEGGQVNAYLLSGTQLKVINKQDAIVAVSALSKSSANFSWSGTQTAGGNFPQGSLGPNEPGTISIQVYQTGTNTAAPAVAYTPGSAVITLATPLDSGSNLNVWYYRADGGSVEVEDSASVASLALTSHGTGKIQQFSDQSSQGLISASAQALLQLAQQSLVAYDTPPTDLDVILYKPGILPGQIWTWALEFNSQLNGQWFVLEVKAELVPVFPWMDRPQVPNAGHYRYTIRVVDEAQIASYLDVWLGFSGGGSGGGALGAGAPGPGALAPTSGAGLSTTGNYGPIIEINGATGSGEASGIANFEAGTGVTLTDLGSGNYQIASSGATPTSAAKYMTSWTSQTSVTVNHALGTTAVIVQVYDGSGNLVIPQNVQIVDANNVALTFGASFSGSVTVVGIGAIPSAQSYTTSWTLQTSVTVTHNLGTENVFVQVTDTSGNVVIPQGVDTTSSAVVTLTFGAAFSGSVLVIALEVRIKQVNASWTSQTSVTVTHNLGTTAVIVQVYDTGGNQVVPQNVLVQDANNVILTFGASFSGSCVIMG